MGLAEFLSQIRWRPQIGDPSFMGWLTVAAYGAAAVLCVIAALGGQPGTAGETRSWRRLWLGVAALMAFLCVNKQLDLQSLFTDIGRVVAARGGWYDQRRIVQRLFVIAVAAASGLAFAVAAWKFRAVLRERLSLLVGLGSLLTFIVVRAASFHHFDVFINRRVLNLRVNWILELGGIAVIALSAARAARRHPAGQKHP